MVKRALLLLLVAIPARASELTVDKRTLQLDDTVTITLSVDGALASAAAPKIPLQNLAIDNGPNVSTEFQWINGETSRRKVFTYTAHALQAGPASVGPVTLDAHTSLPAVTLTVMPDVTAGSNDPARMMRELLATNRDPIFVIASADKTNVFEGEEVVVTWTLYAGVSVQQYALGEIPKLDDFWTEELDVRGERPEEIVLDGIEAQKVTLRRAALFPLRSGTLNVGSLGVRAAVMKRMSAGDPFGLFEGVMSDVHRRSAPLTIAARPRPSGPPVTAVTGQGNLQCGGPSQKSGGPVVFDVSLTGRANLRSAEPPAWDGRVDGTVQIIDRGVSVFPQSYDAWMTRRWRYLVFPGHSGAFKLPGLESTFLTPEGERRTVRCEAKTIDVSTSSAAGLAPPPVKKVRTASWLRETGIAIAAIVTVLLLVPRARRNMKLKRDVNALLRDTPQETRDAVEAALIARGLDPFTLMRESSDRGDAFRAFRSLIDAAERDRIIATRRDIAHRLRALMGSEL